MNTYTKKKIEETIPHAFEKKVLEREMAKGEPRVDLFYKKNETKMEGLNLNVLRTEMKREGMDITKEEIQEIRKLIPVEDHMIQITIYKKKSPVEKRKAVLFIHGGGFFGGDVQTKGNQCRYLAEQSDAVVISPEYRLAPETPYPGPLNDVMGTLDWIEEHAEELGIDKEKIAISGESAGGTLAVNCCLADDENRIKLALIVYGALDLLPAEQTKYGWNYSKYEMYPEQKDYIMNRLFRFKEMTEFIQNLYIGNGYNAGDGDISPVYAEDVSRMPKTVMIEAEFDYFRLSNEEFVKKLQKNEKDVEVILYEGLDHGFFDRLGMLPQTADCIEEMAKYVKEM